MGSTYTVQPFRIAIVGSGAVGCYYGGRLAWRGRDVHFLMRSDAAYVRKHGLRVQSHHGDFIVPKVHVHESSESIGPVDVVFIGLKATANEALETLLPPLLHDETMLVTVQNGLGSDDFLAERFGAARVISGVCFVCINRTSPGHISHTAQGMVSLGEYQGWPRPRLHDLATEFKHCAVPCSIVEDVTKLRWQKLCWNIPFNGLAIAGGGITTDKILADPTLAAETRSLMDEVMQAATALGHPLHPEQPERHLKATLTMAAYKPSSLIDFQEGREVEVEAIWGEPLRRAQAAGLPMPRLQALYDEIKRRLAARG